MDYQWFDQIYKHKLYKQLCKTSLDSLHYSTMEINFTIYKHILRKSISIAKKYYYHKYFNQYKSNLRKNKINVSVKSQEKSEFPKEFSVGDRYIIDIYIITVKHEYAKSSCILTLSIL